MKLSPVVVICFTVVAVSAILAIVLMVITVDQSALPEGWLSLFIGLVPAILIGLVNLAKTDRLESKVEDLGNGKMDAKIRAGVADVMRPEHVDPLMAAQLDLDRQRRDSDQ